MEFEWDERKREQNLTKHGIDFLRATLVFDQPHLVTIDDRKDYREDRFVVIGSALDLILAVVYAKRSDNIRIISARKARKDERRNYYESFARRD